MKINNIQITSFRATKIDLSSAYAKRPKEIQTFYQNIEQFYNSSITKNCYLNNLVKNVGEIHKKGVDNYLTKPEKVFIGVMYSSLDLSDASKISKKFLKESIDSLAKNFKK